MADTGKLFWIANESRAMRLAIGYRSFGGNPQIRSSPPGVSHLIREALERCGFKASNHSRFNGHTVITGQRGVYAIAAVGLGVVKIGWSDDIDRRKMAIAQWLPVDVVLLGKICEVSIKCEQEMHRKMAQWHQRGEWFRFTEQSRAFICDTFRTVITDELADRIGVQPE